MSRILITGGAGFIGSNLIDHFLEEGHSIVCLDNLSTGFEQNICHNYNNPKFKFFLGDIRNLEDCKRAMDGCEYVSHQAALGSVPRSISDPINTNSVNIDGFLNILVAANALRIKRVVYAASSSTYGDSNKIPKIENEIGKPLSPYAVTKYVNELYAEVFSKLYDMQCIGLRYFNVFGKRQDPNGAYAAVIPLWVKQLINHKKPLINGDGSYSRDFTYIENVVQANEKALFTPVATIMEAQRKFYNSLSHNGNGLSYAEVFNIAYGGNTSLIELFKSIRSNLAKYDKSIGTIEPEFGPSRQGDIPHSQASILKAKAILNYHPQFNADKGLELATNWYFKNLSC